MAKRATERKVGKEPPRSKTLDETRVACESEGAMEEQPLRATKLEGELLKTLEPEFEEDEEINSPLSPNMSSPFVISRTIRAVRAPKPKVSDLAEGYNLSRGRTPRDLLLSSYGCNHRRFCVQDV